jgi:hypothetical protein
MGVDAFRMTHVFSIRRGELPSESFLHGYRESGAYTDCFVAEVTGVVSQEDFVNAFYTTFAFKLERWILKWLVAKPSTDAEVVQLASGCLDMFAAWRVEKRCENQLLLCDYLKRTRSWLMIERVGSDTEQRTRLYFGSAIVPIEHAKSGKASLGPVFRALLGFHKIYSVVLLRSAKSRVLVLRSQRRSVVEET